MSGKLVKVNDESLRLVFDVDNYRGGGQYGKYVGGSI